MDIKINIKNKIAVLAEPFRIVCGNSDYTAVFSFDDEWDAYPIKTARFVNGGNYTDVVFEGNRCAIPVMQNITGVYIGVYAGNLHTTTPAFIVCDKSILCSGGIPEEPTPNVYAQLLELISAMAGSMNAVMTINGSRLRFFVGEQTEYDALTEEQRQGLFAIITDDKAKEDITSAIATLQKDVAELKEKVGAKNF